MLSSDTSFAIVIAFLKLVTGRRSLLSASQATGGLASRKSGAVLGRRLRSFVISGFTVYAGLFDIERGQLPPSLKRQQG